MTVELSAVDAAAAAANTASHPCVAQWLLSLCVADSSSAQPAIIIHQEALVE